MPLHRSVCPLDCPDRCSLDVQIEDGRIASITGNRVNPLTGGYICAKVRRYPERVYGADRLLHPMRRTGPKGRGRFEPISWEAALDTIARRIEEVRASDGGEAILPFAYGGSNGLLSQGTFDERLFRSLGASRLLRTVCAAQTGAASQALYGKMASVDFPDFARARCILIWGANPKHSNIHLMPYLKQARESGGLIALIDPRRTLSEAYADVHLPVHPGTDAAVALAMIGHLERLGRVDHRFLAEHSTGAARLLEAARRWPLERAAAFARVEARDIARICEAYAEADPALVRCGWGVERNRNGEAAVAAILALPAVAGKFGKPGGGYALSSSEAYSVNSERLAGGPEPATRAVNMSQLGRVLLEERKPPVKLLFVYDANPLVTLPDQNRVQAGLLREDLFTVVFDQVRTDTALFADILLPATTFLEQSEVSTSYGSYAVMLSEPVIQPLGEARPNVEVFRLLAERLGIDCGLRLGDGLLADTLDAIEGPLAGEARPAPRGEGRLARLRRDGILGFDFPGGRPVQFGTVSPRTSDARIHLWPEELGQDPYRVLEDPADAEHPLALVSPSTDRSICSTLGEFGFTQAVLEMHPDDAAARRLADGDEVCIHNSLGEVRAPMRTNPRLRPGVVYLPKGIWNRHTRNGRVGTALVPDALSAASGGACFNDARVQVSRAEAIA